MRRAANKRRTQGFSQNHDFLFQADETKSRDFEDNPSVRRLMAALRTEFSSAAHGKEVNAKILTIREP